RQTTAITTNWPSPLWGRTGSFFQLRARSALRRKPPTPAMNLSLYSAATGMEAQQLNLNTIANNLANVNTPGFKRSKIEFQDLLYQKPRASGSDSGGGNLVPTGVEIGNGTRVASTSKVFTQGQLTNTGEKLDI